jgi:hypothetical protein
MSTVHQATSSKAGGWDVNITPAERLGRILIGLIGVMGGMALFMATPTFLAGTLEVLLILAGLDLVFTGATGHCPLYKKLGYMPKSLQGRHHERG